MGDRARFFSGMQQERQCMKFAVRQTLTEYKERKLSPESNYALEQVPREAMESQSWEIFKTLLVNALSNLTDL